MDVAQVMTTLHPAYQLCGLPLDNHVTFVESTNRWI
jgi:hypothetical protein